MFNLWLVAVVVVAVFVAFFINGLAGFGAGLILVPVVVLLFGVRQGVVMGLFLSLLVGGYLSLLTWKDVDWSVLRPILGGASLFCWIGALFLSVGEGRWLQIGLGGMTMSYGLYLWWVPDEGAWWLVRHYPRKMSLLLGGLSGFLQGVYGTGGPPIVMLLSQLVRDKRVLRATLLAYFFVLNGLRVLIVGWLAYVAKSDWGEGGLGMAGLVGVGMVGPAVLGGLVGVRFQERLSEVGFRRVVAGILVVSGLVLLVG
ncbi:MAG TPA: sulfite exporter TauE/SafE family protein [Anaerolineae bacterium]|nr:sulfite exporter TauE/SafE family protein [Anaerolineae bacterium]